MADNTSPHPDATGSPIERAEAIVRDARDAEIRHLAREARRRRLLAALHDLGLLTVVSPTWVRAGHDGYEFTTLDDRATERLLVALEDLADAVPVRSRPTATSSDVPLFSWQTAYSPASAPSAN